MIRVRNNSALTSPIAFPTASTIVPFDTVDINSNSSTALSQDVIQISNPGYYNSMCVVELTNSGDAAVTATLTAYSDGNAVTGAAVSATIPASASAEIVLPWTVHIINAVSGIANIGWHLSGAAVSLTNAYAEVKRVV